MKKTILNSLLSEFFQDKNSPVQFKSGLNGQNIIDNIIYLGDKAGQKLGGNNLAHEMCHFVEIDDARMKELGWGLGYREVEVFGSIHVEPTKMHGVERELRVFAFQANLLEALGYVPKVKRMVSVLKYMPDFFLVPLENGKMPFADGYPSKYKGNIDESRIRWMTNKTKELRKIHTMDMFVSEWKRKIKVLEQ